ncbi:hypothetical protein [Salinispira pacifica]
MYGVKATKTKEPRLPALAALLLLTLALLPLPAVAQSASGSSGTEGVGLTIRYFDKSIYTPGGDIMIQVTIANNSGSTYRFRLADNRMYSIDFDVRSMTNVEPPRSQKFTTQLNTNQPAFFREISIDPGEQYSFTENLSDFYDISDPGMYVVTAMFYPELHNNIGMAPSSASAVLTSNRLTLSVRPSVQGVAAIQERINQETGEVLSREGLPPDQVVSFTLQARQKGDWNRFFLYLDIPSLIRRDPARARSFLRLSEADQQAYIQKFKNELKQQTTASDIVVVPSSFQIVRTSYTPDRGTVEVIEKFDNGSFTEVKRYTYTLERRDRIWYIVNYDVQNVGTE